jgi:cytochrome c553
VVHRLITCSLVCFLIFSGPRSFAEEERERLLRYGEQLAGECFTCHRRDGVDAGIPGITSMTEQELLTALTLYKTGQRKNKVVRSVAASLDENQIRALVTYLASLNNRPRLAPGTKAGKSTK